jgi:hypothetical protein
MITRTTGKTTSPAEPPKPKPRYEHYQTIRVPAKVHDSESAVIVDHEWGPYIAGRKSGVKCSGWVYYLKFPDRQEWWLAGEDEVKGWQEV